MLHTMFRGNWPTGSGGFLKGFLNHIWVWRPSWSCDLDAVNKLSFPLPMEVPYKILALIDKAVREKMIEIVGDGRQQRRPDAGSWLYYKLTW